MPEDKIGQSLGLEPIEDVKNGEVISPTKPEIVVSNEPTEQDNDFQYARENFYNVIEKGTQALEDMIDVAKASEHPRAYEVIATIMKTLTDANKDLVKMGEDRAVRKEKKEEKEDGGVTNNLFVGSTAELQQMLKDMRSNDE
jgi:hypothetical protein